MRDDAQDDGVKLMFTADFEPDRLSKREIEALRAILPQLMLELIQSMPEGENGE